MKPTRSFGAREAGRVYSVRPAAYAVILDSQRRIACVGESSGLFLPGGGTQERESPEETVAREVREECAFEVTRLERLCSAVQFFVSGEGSAYELHATFFRTHFGSATGSVPELRLHFLPVEEAVQRLFHECHRWALEVASGRPEHERA